MLEVPAIMTLVAKMMCVIFLLGETNRRFARDGGKMEYKIIHSITV